MNRQPARRSSLFLMELIIAILFFSLASTVCVRFFIKSHSLEENSRNLNHAVTAATSVAEIFRSQERPFLCLSAEFPLGEATEKSYQFYYDKSWALCSSEDASYTVLLDIETADSFLIGNISVSENENSLYQLNIKKYLDKEEHFNDN